VLIRSAITALLTAGVLAGVPPAHAQSATVPPQPGIQVGQMAVTGPSWEFSSNLPNLSGPWGSVTVTNTNCTIPYRPGTAQAGAVIFTAALRPGAEASGTLHAFIGSAAAGQVKLLPMADSRGINVMASLNGLEPLVQGTILSVCLTLNSPPLRLAYISVGQQRVAAADFDVTGVSIATTDTNEPLIAISGTQTTLDDTNRQWVFFFLGDDFLGTDTGDPSLSPLQLVGSPGQNQLDVSYADPEGGDSVTITYTLSEGALDSSDTPPGH
jgi:hypothetical protein